MQNKAQPIAVPVDKPTTIGEVDDDFMVASIDGRLRKTEVDYTNAVDEVLPKAHHLAKESRINEALELLSPLEKLSRIGSDMKSNSRLVRSMVKLTFDSKNYDLFGETIKSLCKKRSLIKYSIKCMIRDSCEMVDSISDESIKNQLIEVLRTVTAGKIYVEVERARLTKRVVDKLEKAGKVEEAREMIMELQIETYGSMEVREKVQYLLHQMRLSIQLGDYFRAGVISKKISVKFFAQEDEEIQSMKLEYFNYMIGIGLYEENFLEVCKHYLAIYQDQKIKEDPVKLEEMLKRIVVYILLSSYDNEQSDLMHRINEISQIEIVPKYKSLLELFIKQEIIFWKNTIIADYEDMLRSGVLLDNTPWNFIFSKVFPDDSQGTRRFELFHKCVGEHNVRMIAKYYTRISFERMAHLLEFSVEEMETFLCKLIADGVVSSIKIHRPSRVIHLRPKRFSIDILDEWGSNVRKLTNTLDRISHLILKEEMVHGVRVQS